VPKDLVSPLVLFILLPGHTWRHSELFYERCFLTLGVKGWRGCRNSCSHFRKNARGTNGFPVRWTLLCTSLNMKPVSLCYVPCLSFVLRNNKEWGSYLPASHRGDAGLIPGQSTWDLWWMKRNWDRFFSQNFGFPLPVSFDQYCLLIYSSITGAI
jgi:hypothetical protein